MNTYKPQPSLIRGIWTIFGVFFLAFFLLGITSGTATVESMVKGMSFALILCLIIPVLSSFARITIFDHKLRAIKWISSKTIETSKIQSVKFRKSFVGMLTDIRVSYIDERGVVRESIIGTLEAYGNKATSKILKELTQLNPRITLDQKAEHLVSNQ